jgi:F-type H+-transporting ATPase subunit epsilon
MAMTMHVDIVSAEREIFSGTANMVFAPAEMGEVGIMPRHTPLLTRLKSGEIRVQRPEGQEDSFYISGGLLEVQPHIVTVLADTAQRATDIDEAAALEAKQRAEEALMDREGKIDYARAQAELAEAIAQLRVIERLRKKLGHRR